MHTGKALAIVLSLVLVLAGCGGGKKGPDTKKAGGEADGAKVTVVGKDTGGKDNVFEPAEVKVTADKETTIHFENKGTLPHTFTVKELGADSGIVDAGASKDVKVKAAAGTIEITCSVHPEMKGELTAS